MKTKESVREATKIDELVQATIDLIKSDPDVRSRVENAIKNIEKEEAAEIAEEVQTERERYLQQRMMLFNTLLEEFNIKGLSAGDPDISARGCENIGIYIDNKIIDTVRSHGNLGKFSTTEFLSKVKELLWSKNIIQKPLEIVKHESKVLYEMDNDIYNELTSHGVSFDKHLVYFPNIEFNGQAADMYNDGENERVIFSKKGNGVIEMIFLETDGQKVIYDIKNGIWDIDSRRVIPPTR